MNNLVDRLREPCRRQDFDSKHCKQRNDDRKWWCAGCLGAERIKELEAENERLRDELFLEQRARKAAEQ